MREYYRMYECMLLTPRLSCLKISSKSPSSINDLNSIPKTLSSITISRKAPSFKSDISTIVASVDRYRGTKEPPFFPLASEDQWVVRYELAASHVVTPERMPKNHIS